MLLPYFLEHFLLLKGKDLCWIGSALRSSSDCLSSNSVGVSVGGFGTSHPQGEHLTMETHLVLIAKGEWVVLRPGILITPYFATR